MNNKAFTLTELLIVIGIVALLTIMVLPVINRINQNNEIKKYQSYEKMVAEYAEASMVSDSTNLCDINGVNEASLDDVKKLCVGYVRIIDGKYKAYISCEKADYKTDGYSASISGGRVCE